MDARRNEMETMKAMDTTRNEMKVKMEWTQEGIKWKQMDATTNELETLERMEWM